MNENLQSAEEYILFERFWHSGANVFLCHVV